MTAPPEPALDAPVNEIVEWLHNMQTGTLVSAAMRERVFGLTEHLKFAAVNEYAQPFGTHPHLLARWVAEHVARQVTATLAPGG